MTDKQLCSRLNKTILSVNDILQVEQYCYDRVKENELYILRNEAKLRAVNCTKTYEEFRDIVDAAHLRKLDKSDKQNVHTKNRLWNSAATK